MPLPLELTGGAAAGLAAIGLYLWWERRPPTVRARRRCCPDCDQPNIARPLDPPDPLRGSLHRAPTAGPLVGPGNRLPPGRPLRRILTAREEPHDHHH